MNKALFDKIKALRDERRANHLYPDFVKVQDICSVEEYKNLYDDILNAIKEGYVKVHRGLNYNLIELLKDEYDE